MRAEAFQWFVRGMGLAIGIGLVIAVASGVIAAGRVLVLVLIALLLASGLEPFVGWIRTHVRLGRGATILIVYLAFLVFFVTVAFLVIPGAVVQFNQLGSKIPDFLHQVREWASTVKPAAVSETITALVDSAQRTLRGGGAAEPGAVLEAGVTLAHLVISIVTILALVFFWLTEHAHLQRYALAFLPPARRSGARETWNEIEGRLGSWVRGQLILMGALGVMLTVAYAILGLEGAILLGLIAAIAEAIPIVGPLLGAIPAVLVAAATGRIELVLAVAAVYAVVQIVEGNVLVPMIMRNTIGISPFLVITSILVGAAVGGVVGAFLAVPATAAIEVILERLQARDTPVPLDPAGSAHPTREAREAAMESLADSSSPTSL